MNITIYSNFRNSMPYIERYLSQVLAVSELFEHTTLCWLEGDSTDNTYDRLATVEGQHISKYLLKEDTGAPYYPSQSSPERWAHLERIWNKNIHREEPIDPNDVALVVESDLIWDADVVKRLYEILTARAEITAVYPMLWGNGQQGKLFYDTNGFRRNGKHFKNLHPFIPEDTGEPFLELDTGGGLILTRNKHLKHAVWKNGCTLHFHKESLLILDRNSHVYHP